MGHGSVLGRLHKSCTVSLYFCVYYSFLLKYKVHRVRYFSLSSDLSRFGHAQCLSFYSFSFIFVFFFLLFIYLFIFLICSEFCFIFVDYSTWQRGL